MTEKRIGKLLFMLAAALATMAAVAAAVDDAVGIGVFSAAKPGAALPPGWSPVGIRQDAPNTRYTLVENGGITVLRADSAAAASGLGFKQRIDTARHPWLRWRWNIGNIIESADARTREGDDFPARLYVMFDYPLEKLPFVERNKLRLARALFDPDLPAATLCYVWDNKLPAGTILSSAYTERVKVIVVESGAARIRRWVPFERNIAEDFRAAFGETAPAVTGIVVATDTDNTGTSATTLFGDISFNKQRVEKSP